MLVTILEGRVGENKWEVLEKTYHELTQSKVDAPSESYLIQSKSDPELWKIVSIWQDEEILKKVRTSGKTPAGILVFRSSGVEPTLNVFEVKESL